MATRPVVGVVRDKDSGEPLAGVIVQSYLFGGADDYNGTVRTATDKEGRYRLVGLPKGEGNEIIAVCPRCGATDLYLTAGEELILESIEYKAGPSGPNVT